LTLSQQKKTAYFAGEKPEKRTTNFMDSSHTIKSRGFLSPGDDKENITPAQRLHNNHPGNGKPQIVSAFQQHEQTTFFLTPDKKGKMAASEHMPRPQQQQQLQEDALTPLAPCNADDLLNAQPAPA